MAKCKLVALTTPLPGKEAEFHDWYQNAHLPEILSIPGFEGAQRFKLVAKIGGSDTNQYLAIYDGEADDPSSLLQGLGDLVKSGKMTPPIYSEKGTGYTALFTECDEYLKAD